MAFFRSRRGSPGSPAGFLQQFSARLFYARFLNEALLRHMATPAAPAAPGVGSFGGFSSALAGRHAVFALVMLLLFLSARSDLEQPERQLVSEGSRERGAAAPVVNAKQETVKEQARGYKPAWLARHLTLRVLCAAR